MWVGGFVFAVSVALTGRKRRRNTSDGKGTEEASPAIDVPSWLDGDEEIKGE